jgi:uncharacterized OsmC-like protein
MSEHEFRVDVRQRSAYEFAVSFDWEGLPELALDEPEPLGGQKGPNASRLVAAAVGNCLAASLFFCLQRSRFEVEGLSARVQGSLARNPEGRLRIAGFDVRIELPINDEEHARVQRCLDLFEDFCVVTASVRQGIPVSVSVVDRNGAVLLGS